MADLKSLTQSVIGREEAKFDQLFQEYREEQLKELEQKKEQLREANQIERQKVEANRLKQHEIALGSTQLRQRNDMLAIKQNIIQQFITDVKDQLTALSPELIQEFIWNVIKELPSQEGIKLILGSETFYKLDDKFEDFKKAGLEVENEPLKGASGFILEQGNTQYNYLFDNLVNDYREQLQHLVVEKLFNDK